MPEQALEELDAGAFLVEFPPVFDPIGHVPERRQVAAGQDVGGGGEGDHPVFVIRAHEFELAAVHSLLEERQPVFLGADGIACEVADPSPNRFEAGASEQVGRRRVRVQIPPLVVADDRVVRPAVFSAHDGRPHGGRVYAY